VLVGVGLVGAGLVGAGLVGAGLVGAGLVGAGLDGAGLDGAGLVGEAWCVGVPDPAAERDDDSVGDGEVWLAPGPGCPPLLGCELWLLGDTAVETSIAT
jgi:hypothetical protein